MNVSSSSKPRRYLIAIGSPHCININPGRLPRVETDIEKVVKLFTSETQGYERVLAEIPLGSSALTIKHALSGWFSSSDRKASDYVIVYYAGHGDEVGNFGSHYLFTADSNMQNLSSSAIETSELVKYFFEGAGNRSANILLILDVCYAGQGGGQLMAALSKNKNVIKGSGFWVIPSVDSNTEAADGAFVDALEKAMQPSDWMASQEEFLNPQNLIHAANQYLSKDLQAQISSLGQSTQALFIRNPTFKRNLDKVLENGQEEALKKSNELKKILQPHDAEFSKMQQAYQATVKARLLNRRRNIETVESLITELLRIPKGSSDFTALEEFAAWLNSISENQKLISELNNWGQQHCKDWRELVQQIDQRKEQDAKVQTALLIMISYSDEAATQSQDGEVYRVEVLLIENVEQYKKAPQGELKGCRKVGKSKLTGDETYSWEEIPDVLKELLEEENVDDELSSESEVHIFLPQELLNCDADCWKLIKGIKNYISIGHKYNVFVRLYERLSRNYKKSGTWKRKWKQKDGFINAFTIFKGCDDCDLGDIDGLLCQLNFQENKHMIGVKLIKALNPDSFTDFAELILEGGLPLAIWGRSKLSESTNEAELNRILEACKLEDLPETVKRERFDSRNNKKSSDCHIGHHLSLLWDDPDLVPPKSA
jgi:hypothetical protein